VSSMAGDLKRRDAGEQLRLETSPRCSPRWLRAIWNWTRIAGFCFVGVPAHEPAAIRFLQKVVGDIGPAANVEEVSPERRRGGIVENAKGGFVDSACLRFVEHHADQPRGSFHDCHYVLASLPVPQPEPLSGAGFD
jgi:hypothetical protein